LLVQNGFMHGRDVVDRMGFSKKRNAIAVALSLVSVLAVTGCESSSGAIPPDPPVVATPAKYVPHVDAQSAAAMSARVKTAIQDFKAPLPSGVHWFTKTPDQLLQPNTTYADGAAEGVVAFYWLCSWENSYLNAVDKSDTNTAASSLAQIGKWESLPFAVSHLSDPGHGWEKAILTPAKQGDPSAMRASFDSDCLEYKSINPS